MVVWRLTGKITTSEFALVSFTCVTRSVANTETSMESSISVVMVFNWCLHTVFFICRTKFGISQSKQRTGNRVSISGFGKRSCVL